MLIYNEYLIQKSSRIDLLPEIGEHFSGSLKVVREFRSINWIDVAKRSLNEKYNNTPGEQALTAKKVYKRNSTVEKQPGQVPRGRNLPGNLMPYQWRKSNVIMGGGRI